MVFKAKAKDLEAKVETIAMKDSQVWAGAVLGPGQGGGTRPPSCCAGPPVFLGTNYDALSAFVVDDVLRRSCLGLRMATNRLYC